MKANGRNHIIKKGNSIYRHGLNGWQKMNKGKWHSARSDENKFRKPVEKRPVEHHKERPVERPTFNNNERKHGELRDMNRHYHSRQYQKT